MWVMRSLKLSFPVIPRLCLGNNRKLESLCARNPHLDIGYPILINRISVTYADITRNVLLSAQMGERASVVLICIITSRYNEVK